MSQHERGALDRGHARKLRLDVAADFGTHGMSIRRRRLVGCIEELRFVALAVLGPGISGMLTPSDLHQRGVYRDSVQPGRECRATVEVGEMPERAEECLLNRILGGRAIARDAHADAE